jgi:hypothetical protein
MTLRSPSRFARCAGSCGACARGGFLGRRDESEITKQAPDLAARSFTARTFRNALRPTCLVLVCRVCLASQQKAGKFAWLVLGLHSARDKTGGTERARKDGGNRVSLGIVADHVLG